MILKKKNDHSARDRSALAYAYKEKIKECERLKEENAAVIKAAKKAEADLARKTKTADALDNAARSRYLIALKTLKAFADRIDRLASSDATVMEKKAMIDLFKGFWDGSDDLASMKTAVERINAEDGDDGNDDENFDISAALNAEGLDLKKLCEEFGVYQG